MADDKLTKPVYAVLDVETTGLSRIRDRVVQIACLKIGKDDSQKTWMRYVNPKMDSEYLQQAYRIHRISPEFLQKKPVFQDVAESFCNFLKDVDYLVAHNCMFDWDMLSREFEILDNEKNEESSKEDTSKLWWDKFHCNNTWVDTLRLAIICLPKQESYSLQAIKNFLNIDPQQGMAGGILSTDYGGDDWKKHQHDAMYDVYTTYSVLQHCIKSTFHGLVQNYPMALLDTNLLLDMQRLIDENRTSTEDLFPFARRSKEYFATSRPKGKKLGELSKYYLQRLTVYLKADTRSDDRVILIYEAAILEPMENESHSSASMKEKEEKEKKVEAVKEDVKVAKEEKEKEEENEILSHSFPSTKKNAERVVKEVVEMAKEEKEKKENDDNEENEMPFTAIKKNVEKIEKVEAVKEAMKVAKELKVGKEKKDKDDDEENLNCSSEKKPKLSSQESLALL